MIDFKKVLYKHNWNPFNEEENDFVNQKFDKKFIQEASPFSDQKDEKRIGIVLKNNKDESNVIIIWNVENNSEICTHIEKQKVEFMRSPSQLHYTGRKILKSALMGTPEYYQDETEQLESQHWNYMLAEHDRNLIVSSKHRENMRTTMFIVPNKPMNAMFQQFLLKRKRNYVLGKRMLTFFKDPASGESIFSQIGFKIDFLEELKKSVELCAEQHEEGVKDFYPLLLEPSFLTPKMDSLFKKACKISTTFQNAYLAILAESEEDYNTNSVVIPDTTTFKDMIECANFGKYLEACKRQVEPDPIYKAQWPDKEKDRKTFLRPFSYVTLQFKASKLGEPTEPDQKKEIEAFRDREGMTQRKPEESGVLIEEQNVFLEAVQLEFLHHKGGVKEFCDKTTYLQFDQFFNLEYGLINERPKPFFFLTLYILKIHEKSLQHSIRGP